MGYRPMTIDNLKIIFRRWHAGQSLSEIKRTEAFDRNTLRHYIGMFKAAGYSPGCEIRDDQALVALLRGMIPARRRVRKVRQALDAHRSEIIELVSRKDEPLDPKTAFLVVKEKYDLAVSYETFKLFMKENAIKTSGVAPLRIELPPGKETQIDYGLVGTFYDSVTKSNKRVWAFCAKLSCSRLPFIEFVYSQKQESFVESNIRMVEFFGGVTEFLTIDNLKSGVIKPDLYDPLVNRAYAEFAEHYGTFINPCRVRKPDDKGKVERQVPQARMLFRRLKEVHPTYTLAEVNEAARRWCREEYGATKHGTTGIAPLELFDNTERATLIPLPPERFEVPEWKVGVKVAPDRFFQLQGKYYAMPYEYRNRTLNIRKSGGVLRVFDADYSLIREYTITGKSRSWLPGDFPEDKAALMAGEYPQWLLSQARKYGPTTEKLIESILKPHAYLNARRARGILSAIEKYRLHPFLQEVCGKAIKGELRTPGQMTAMLESLSHQQHFDFIIPRSGLGEAMTRDVKEYFN
jgi:transposase